jgi:hypothetical protein
MKGSSTEVTCVSVGPDEKDHPERAVLELPDLEGEKWSGL